MSDLTPVQTSVVVDAAIDHAFKVFTEGFNSWWPREHHLGDADLAEAVIEPFEGGRWYERTVDGVQCDWGRVLAWDPPRRVLLSWHISGEWKYDADSARASEVEVRFTLEGDERTRVELIHSHLDRHAMADKAYEGVSSANGWPGILRSFQAACS